MRSSVLKALGGLEIAISSLANVTLRLSVVGERKKLPETIFKDDDDDAAEVTAASAGQLISRRFRIFVAIKNEKYYLSDIDLAVPVIVVGLEETLLELGQHGVRDDLDNNTHFSKDHDKSSLFLRY